ncbi:30S ribosomal protein S4 [Rothia endophytica]|uniref:Small ribosomal subunit protein uS4 n=1 Tax=Rothia endophytica TaxID=1324766 RepID=A0ABP9BE17_9MICC|nr:30S ribosomal protein S4 [Rothia sp. P100]SLF11442.1 SSU ribosomal protein S4P [Mycobacteroides abscessus subsp. bolletii]
MANHNRTRRTVRQSRALGIALTPKAEKYFERRPYGPGQHGRARKKADSNYAVQLKEKQRLRAQYNIREAQMRRAYLEAKRIEGQTGKNLVEILETRLDALVLRSGFTRTIAQARQAVVHRHIMVDGVRVDRPSFRVKPGQLIHVHPKSEKMAPFQVAATGAHQDVLPDTPPYLNVEIEKLHAKLERAPKREEIPVICEEQLVVEYYSRLA